MTDLTQQINEGNEAHRELTMTREARKSLRSDCFSAFEYSEPEDDEGRRRVWYQLRALREIEQYLERAVGDGNAALEELRKREGTESENP